MNGIKDVLVNLTDPGRFLLAFILSPLTTLILLVTIAVAGAPGANSSNSRATVPKPHSTRNSSRQIPVAAQAADAEATVTFPAAYGEPLLLLLSGLVLLAVATVVKLKIIQRQTLGSQKRELFSLEAGPNTDGSQSILSGGK